MYQIKISVRNLVEFILRSGDITTGGSGLKSPEAMLEGTRIHQKLQREMQKKGETDYQAEVPLSIRIPVHKDPALPVSGETKPAEADSPESEGVNSKPIDFEILLDGRADGIFRDENGFVIDEIKGIYRKLHHIKKPEIVHTAQACCYAYIYASSNRLSKIGVQITYCHIPTEQVRYYKEYLSFEELEKWFTDLIDKYAKWCVFQLSHFEERDQSIKKFNFPFSYRPGQRELAGGVYQSIVRKKRLYIEAPTGVGKTISTTFPTVKSIGEKYTEKIFYLTAKTITRTVAEKTFSLMEEKGVSIKYITLTAKEKICMLEKPNCDPDSCSYAKGHFDRINDAMYDLLTHENHISRECIIDYAKKHQVCPFELSLDVSNWTDIIIGDYNYAFDPTASLKRYFAGETENDYVFLIDEAHNLVDRAREMYSASLIKEDFLATKKITKLKSEAVTSALGSCNRALLDLKKLCEDVTLFEPVQLDSFMLRLIRLIAALEELLLDNNPSENPDYKLLSPDEREKLLEFYFSVKEFSNIYELVDEHYIIYGDYTEDNNFRLHLQCMDPSENLNTCLNKGRSAIFFSATLLPIHYYKEQLASREDDYAVYAPSPFEKENRLLMIGKGVSTKYSMRGKEMYQKITDYLRSFFAAKSGNYLVFFPSYKFLQTISELLREAEETEPSSVRFLEQNPHMSEEERITFLARFEEQPECTTVGLCVMGGIFGEGIDLTGEKLIGAAIVGTGLPMVCPENELYKDYFDKTKKDGFSYAYRYPGMNKVLQAAGRVIRTTSDRGVILLLDDRFLQSNYKQLFPREWHPYHTVTPDSMPALLRKFWENTET